MKPWMITMASEAGVSTVSPGVYKNVDSFILENDFLKVNILPERGSKTASIIHKHSGSELLWQNPEPHFIESGYGTPYTDGDKSGFDEMFPSIKRCFCEDFPWEGTEIPDHGEVWSIPWNSEMNDNSLMMNVDGVRFPYKLRKEVSLNGGTIHYAYTVKNKSPHPFSCIWAAHPLFNTVPGMVFRVPEGMNRIVNAEPGEPLGRYGKELSFPVCAAAEGKKLDLSVVPEKTETGYQKYYFKEPVTEGWCEMINPENHLLTRLSFPKDKVPYLGMWLNVMGWADQYNIAPEPATAAMDRIDLSGLWGSGSILGPYEEHHWYFDITVSDL